MTESETRPPGYFTRLRSPVIDAVPPEAARILEIGCGDGRTLRELKSRLPGRYVAGTDVVEGGSGLDVFVRGDFEKSDFPFQPGQFDVVICADVLEHLLDPWAAVRRCVGWLAPGGHMIVTLPNFSEMKNLWSVGVRRDFRYEPAGIRDVGHFRFFCRRNAVQMLGDAGLAIDQVRLLGGRPRVVLDRLTLGLFSGWLAYQWMLVAQKPKGRRESEGR